MLLNTEQRQPIRDVVFFLTFALGIILFVFYAMLSEGVFFADGLGLLFGVGTAVVVLRRMRELSNWGCGIDRTRETREQSFLTYVQSFGMIGFNRSIAVELLLSLGLEGVWKCSRQLVVIVPRQPFGVRRVVPDRVMVLERVISFESTPNRSTQRYAWRAVHHP